MVKILRQNNSQREATEILITLRTGKDPDEFTVETLIRNQVEIRSE